MADNIAYSRQSGMWFNLDNSINPNEKKVNFFKFLYPTEYTGT